MVSLNQIILKLGFYKALIIITILSISLSLVITYFSIILIFGESQKVYDEMHYYLIISIIVPLFVAPMVSFAFIKLLFKIDDLEKETRYLATYDVLTGLYTRRAFYEHAEKQLKASIRSRIKFAILVGDLDGFKSINDLFGHHAGDMALKCVSNVIKETVRASDIAGRVGGDEFIFYLPNTTLLEAESFGVRLVKNIHNTSFSYENNVISLSISIGLVTSPVEDDLHIDTLIKEADNALYRAKKSGKNRVAY
jgi:diguanylate cyclase (GGDEF)-like protein